MKIWEKVRYARIIRSLSQEEFGRALKITKQAVSLIEKGKVKISDQQLQKISVITKKPIEYFLNNDLKDDQKKLTLGMKIRLARTESDLSQWDFARKLNIRQGAISRYELDEVIPPVQTIKKICVITGKPLFYFLDDPIAEAKKLITNLDIEKCKYIPLFGEVAAGVPVERLDQLPVETSIPAFNNLPGVKDAKGAFRVVSDSMEPLIHKWSYVLIDNTKMAQSNDIALLHIRDKGTCIKQICFMPGNKIKLIPRNKKHQEAIYKMDDVFILGKVVGSITPL